MLHGDDVHKPQHPLPSLVLQVTLIATASLITTITRSSNIVNFTCNKINILITIMIIIVIIRIVNVI